MLGQLGPERRVVWCLKINLVRVHAPDRPPYLFTDATVQDQDRQTQNERKRRTDTKGKKETERHKMKERDRQT